MRQFIVTGSALTAASALGLAGCATSAKAPSLTATSSGPSTIGEAVVQPVKDLGLTREKPPEILIKAVEAPYRPLADCAQITAEIAALDQVLGRDLDEGGVKEKQNVVGDLAVDAVQSATSLPFRGVIREVSGANAQQRAWDRALYAGSVRRAFLKGMGASKGCAYPAAPATPQVVAMLNAKRAAERAAKKAKPAERTAGAPVQVAYQADPMAEKVSAAPR